MKKIVLITLLTVVSATSFAKGGKAVSQRKPSSKESCLAANKMLAENILKNAGKRIGFDEVSEVTLEWVSAASDRYVFSGSIYRGNYEIVVKTDSSCFPQEVELIDTARQ